MIFDNNIFSAGLPFNLAQGNVAISHKVRGQRSEVRGQRSEVKKASCPWITHKTYVSFRGNLNGKFSLQRWS